MKTLEVGKSYCLAGCSNVMIKIINRIGDVFIGVRLGDTQPYNAQGKLLEWGTLQPLNANEPGYSDLVIPKETLIRWVNIYHFGDPRFTNPAVSHLTREDADLHAGPGRFACVRVEAEEGDGL